MARADRSGPLAAYLINRSRRKTADFRKQTSVRTSSGDDLARHLKDFLSQMIRFPSNELQPPVMKNAFADVDERFFLSFASAARTFRAAAINDRVQRFVRSPFRKPGVILEQDRVARQAMPRVTPPFNL
jgi:hypothetical protein